MNTQRELDRALDRLAALGERVDGVAGLRAPAHAHGRHMSQRELPLTLGVEQVRAPFDEQRASLLVVGGSARSGTQERQRRMPSPRARERMAEELVRGNALSSRRGEAHARPYRDQTVTRGRGGELAPSDAHHELQAELSHFETEP